MPRLSTTKTQRQALIVATVLAILVGAWFLKHYLILIIFAAIVAYLFSPIHFWLIRKGRSPGQAATLTFFVSLLAIIIPFIIVISVTVLQVEKVASTLSAGNYTVDLGKLGTEIINDINKMLTNIGLSAQITPEGIADALKTSIEKFSQNLLEGIIGSLSSIIGFITIAIIYIYVFISMLRHKNKIIETVYKLNPLGRDISKLYIERMGLMTKATVRGQFIIAICQGLESAIVLYIAGFHNLFYFFALLLTTLSVIPLGAGIVTIPIGIALILTGNIWQGVLVIANHLLIVTNIDNVLRPRLVPAQARLDPALMILAVFSGLAFFGFLGIVIGPVLMIVLVTTIQVYLEVFRGGPVVRDVRGGSSGPGLVTKLKKIVSRESDSPA